MSTKYLSVEVHEGKGVNKTNPGYVKGKKGKTRKLHGQGRKERSWVKRGGAKPWCRNATPKFFKLPWEQAGN